MSVLFRSYNWREYDAEKAERNTVSFGVNGKLINKLSVEAKVKAKAIF